MRRGPLALDKAADDDRYPTGDHGVQTNSNRRLSNVRRCISDSIAHVRDVEHPDSGREKARDETTHDVQGANGPGRLQNG